MQIVNLIENTEGHPGCHCEHGLSFYIETEKHKILADAGATGAFLENAQKLGIDLGQTDTVIVSHGHYDHTGGLLLFAEKYPEAVIYLQRLAGEAYYHINGAGERYIGMASGIKKLPQAVWLEGDRRIDRELFLFGQVRGRRLWPRGNRELKRKENGTFIQDEFLHEQYLVVEERGKRVLISGCAHNGILNILDRYREIFGGDPEAVVSGFHMNRKNGYGDADLELIRQTAAELCKMNTRFYTGHCTGELPYRMMKEIMGAKLEYVHSGEKVRLS